MTATDPAETLQRLREALCRPLQGSGAELYVVGGAVRDLAAGRAPRDWDLLVRHPDLDAEPLEALLRERLAPQPLWRVGQSFGVFKVRLPGGPEIDLALPCRRTPGEWRSDPRLPLELDLARRDFTVGAMALPLCTPQSGITDPFGGLDDLAARRLRATGDAGERLAEDPVRILRAARLLAAYHLEPDPALTAAARAVAPQLPHAAPERRWAEWLRLFGQPRTALGLRWLAATGALTQLVPAWAEIDGLQQHHPRHSQTVSDHILSVVTELDRQEADAVTKLAGFFHDIGKGRTRTLHQTPAGMVGHFYGHEDAGSDLARQSLQNLRADQDTASRVARLVQLHMRPGQVQSRRSARRLAAAAGPDLERLLALHRADRLAHVGEDPAALRQRTDLIRSALDDLPAEGFSARHLALSGHRLVALGMPPRTVGQCKEWLTGEVLDERLPNDEAALLQAAQQWWAAASASPTDCG